MFKIVACRFVQVLSFAMALAAAAFTSGASGARVENTDAAVAFSTGWATDTSRQWSGGSARTSKTVGAQATLTFTGTSVNWIGARLPSTGIAKVYVDGLFRASVDTFSPNSEEVRVTMYTVNDLANTTHTLTIEATGQKNAAATDALIVVDAFETPAVSVSRLQETDGAVAYSSGWTPFDETREWSEGKASFSAVSGAQATLTFIGTRVTWVSPRLPSTGIASISIDGVHVADVDTYAATEQLQAALFTSSTLTNGTHTLSVQVTGQKNAQSSGTTLYLDAFEVTIPGRRYQDTDPSITYTPLVNWFKDTRDHAYSEGTVVEAFDSATATFPFNGTGVTFISGTCSRCGIVRITIDSGTPVNVDLYEPGDAPQKTVFRTTGLSNGPHVIKVESTGTKNPLSAYYWVVVDGFDVIPDVATGGGGTPATSFAAGGTAIASATNAAPTIVTSLTTSCPASGTLLLTGSGESTALSTAAGTAFIGLAYSISRDSMATDNTNVVQSSALAVFNGDANRDFLNVQRVDSCTPGASYTYRLTAYRTTPQTNATSFLFNGRLTASSVISLPGTGFAAGTTSISSATNATPTIVTSLQVTCPAGGAVMISGSGESTALSSAAGTAFIGLAYSISRDNVATDNANVVQSSALAVFNGDANRDFLNVQRADSCTPGQTSTYRLTAYRTTAQTAATSFAWNGRLVASVPYGSPGAGFVAGSTAVASASNATPTIIGTLVVTCPASGAVMVSGSGESTALSTQAGTAFIGIAYSVARDSAATDNGNVVQSSALATFNGDANRDFLNVQRVDSCTPSVSYTYRLTAYRTSAQTSAGSFVWNGRLASVALP